jgi:hypothetical protein
MNSPGFHTASNTMKKKNNGKRKNNKRKGPSGKTPFADVGGIVGNALSGLTGLNLSGAGRWLGSGIGSIFGSGDYTITGTTPKYNVLAGQTPKFDTTHSTNIISHREYLGDIQGDTPFINRDYPLNPGMAQTFPWLSTIAAGYQQYRFHGIVFEFRPLVTDFITSGSPGVVVMTTNYNPDDALYGSRQEAENADFAVSTKPTMGLMHLIECASEITQFSWYNVRSGSLTTGIDKRAYDWGTFQFISQLNPNQLLGELWVSYCVEFIKPILPLTRGISVDYSYHAYRSSVTAANPLGTAQLFRMGAMDVTVTGTTITIGFIPTNMVLHVIMFVDSTNTATTDLKGASGVVGAEVEYDFGFNGGLSPSAPYLATTGTLSNRSASIASYRTTASEVVLTYPTTGVYPAACNLNLLLTTASV